MRYPIELGVVRRMLGVNTRYLIDLRSVRSLSEVLEKFEVFNRVGCCKENVRRNGRYLIELRAVRSLLEGFRGIR